MAIAIEGSWTSASVSANVAFTNVGITVQGGGAELVVIALTIDTSNSCTGAHLSGHANFQLGSTYVGTSANGVINIIVWGTYSGASGTPTFTVNYDGGNSGASGGKIAYAVFTGYATNILTSPGPSASGTGTSGTASVSVTGVSTGSMVVGLGDNSGNVLFSAGSGYTLQFNTSSWNTNHRTAIETTTNLAEPGGNPTVAMTLTSSTWNFLAAAFPSNTPQIVQSQQSSVASGVTSITATLTNGSTAGNAVFLCAPIKASTNSANLSVTDDKLNTWLPAAASLFQTEGTLFGKSSIWYCLNPAAGTKAITITASTGTLSGSVTAIETIPFSLFDQVGVAVQSTGSSIALTSGQTNIAANDLVLACFQEQGTTSNDGPSVSAGYNIISQTKDGTTNCNMVAFRQNTTVLQDTGTFSWTGGSAANTAAIASFNNPLTPFLARRATVIPLDDIIYY